MLIWILVPFAALLGYLAGRYRAGQLENEGEALVRKAIKEALPGPDWHLLNNITLRTEDGTTQVDHILVSRYGVIVIETKHYKGWIFGNAKSAQWTQVIFKVKHRFQNPLRQNYKHLVAVRQLLDFLPSEHIDGAVVFTGEAEFKTPRPDGVFSLSGLVSLLKKLDTEVLTENRVQFCVGRLECHRLAITRATDIEHVKHLQRKFGEPH
jgi:hypothetical protein